MRHLSLVVAISCQGFCQQVQVAPLSNSYDHTQRVVYGQLSLLGLKYESECVCKAETLQPRNTKHCRGLSPSLTPSESLSVSEFEPLPAKPVSTESFSCMDSRVTNRGFSTVGGDAGEFLLALHLYEHVTSQKEQISYMRMKEAFDGYLRYIRAGKFTFCTDERALKGLFRQANVFLADPRARHCCTAGRAPRHSSKAVGASRVPWFLTLPGTLDLPRLLRHPTGTSERLCPCAIRTSLGSRRPGGGCARRCGSAAWRAQRRRVHRGQVDGQVPTSRSEPECETTARSIFHGAHGCSDHQAR